MPYAKLRPPRALRRFVRELVDPVLACRNSQFTPRYDAALPTLCHRIAALTADATDWACTHWLILRTWASDATRLRTTSPNHASYADAALVLAAAAPHRPARWIHRRLRELVTLGFAREELLHGERTLFWLSSPALLAHLRARWPDETAVFPTLRWLSRRGDRYHGASERRTFLPEIINCRSTRANRAALSVGLRVDAALVNLGRRKQAALLGSSLRTSHRRVARAKRDTHEHVKACYHKLWAPPWTMPPAQQREIIERVIQASRKAYHNGEISSPVLLRCAGPNFVLVRQLPSQSRNSRIYAFTGADYARRFAPRVRQQALRTPGEVPVESSTVTRRAVTPSGMSTPLPENQSVDPLPSRSPRPASVLPFYPTPTPVVQPHAEASTNLHRHLHDRQLTVERCYRTSRIATQQVNVPVRATLHYTRDQYTERTIHALYDWDDTLLTAGLGEEAFGPAPPLRAYRQQLRAGRPTLGYFRQYAKLSRPRRHKLLATLGADCFAPYEARRRRRAQHAAPRTTRSGGEGKRI
jgi:hypothetical protein